MIPGEEPNIPYTVINRIGQPVLDMGREILELKLFLLAKS